MARRDEYENDTDRSEEETVEPDNRFERVLEDVRIFFEPEHRWMPVSDSDAPAP